MSDRIYEFECPECEFTHTEAGCLATEKERYCGICADDSGKEVLLNRWLPTSAASVPCSCSPCPVPTNPEQRLDITCSHCGAAIDFRHGEVYVNGPSYVCRLHAEGASQQPNPDEPPSHDWTGSDSGLAQPATKGYAHPRTLTIAQRTLWSLRIDNLTTGEKALSAECDKLERERDTTRAENVRLREALQRIEDSPSVRSLFTLRELARAALAATEPKETL